LRKRVHLGESDYAPRIDLGSGKKKETLEAILGKGVKFTVSVSPPVPLSGGEPDAKSRLFRFKFKALTAVGGRGRRIPMAGMSNMRC
jgi:hypothetical protein